MDQWAKTLFSKLPPPKLKPSEASFSISSGLANNKEFVFQSEKKNEEKELEKREGEENDEGLITIERNDLVDKDEYER